MTPYTKTTIVQTTGADEVIEIPCPGRCYIDNVRFAVEGGGGFVVDLYNRAFTGPPQKLVRIDDDGRGNSVLTFTQNFAARLGDVLAVSHASHPEYNTSHRVIKVIDDKHLVTNVPSVGYEPGSSGVVAQLAIPPGEQDAYRVGTTQTADGGVSGFDAPLAIPFVNQDPQGNANNRGYPHKLYARVGAPGLYQVTLTTHASVSR